MFRILDCNGNQLRCYAHKGVALAALRASTGCCRLEKLVYDDSHTESWWEPIRAHSRLSDALNSLRWKWLEVSTDLLIAMKGV